MAKIKSTSIRVPEDLHEKARIIAIKKKTTLSKLIVDCLKKIIEEYEREEKDGSK